MQEMYHMSEDKKKRERESALMTPSVETVVNPL